MKKYRLVYPYNQHYIDQTSKRPMTQMQTICRALSEDEDIETEVFESMLHAAESWGHNHFEGYVINLHTGKQMKVEPTRIRYDSGDIRYELD